METILMLKIFTVLLCYLIKQWPKKRPEKFRPEWTLHPGLCDAGAVLYQLRYQGDWELVTMWLNDKPLIVDNYAIKLLKFS